MANTEFISYQPTSGQSYSGIVTFRRHGKDILRYKWVAKKDGKGHFASSPSLKIVDEEGERYLPSHLVDSRADNEEMEDILRKGINATIMGKPVIQMSASALQPSSSESDDLPF